VTDRRILAAFVIVVFLAGYFIGRIDIVDQRETTATSASQISSRDIDPATLRLLTRYQFLLEACETGKPVTPQGTRQPSSETSR
jgi:hypothetical protein